MFLLVPSHTSSPGQRAIKRLCVCTSTTTHTRSTALCPGLPGLAGTRKVKPIWILLKQETVSGSGISWAICKSAPRSRQITMPAPHRSVFLQAGCPSCCPKNSVKALKAKCVHYYKSTNYQSCTKYSFHLHFGSEQSTCIWPNSMHRPNSIAESYANSLLNTRDEK